MIFRIPTHPGRYNELGHFDSDSVLNIGGIRHTFGYVSAAGTCRHIAQGPMLPGPYAFLVALPSVIDQHGGSGAEATRNRAAGLEFDASVGDFVEIDGHAWAIVKTGFYSYGLRPFNVSWDVERPQVGDVLEGTYTNLRVVKVLPRAEGGQPRVKVRALWSDGERGAAWELVVDTGRLWIAYRPAPGVVLEFESVRREPVSEAWLSG
jgi:hypothetical protein